MFLFSRRTDCIFCQICKKQAPATILFEDDEVIVFKDIHPASEHHYQTIPKRHIENIRSLTQNDKPLLEKMITIGRQVLSENHGNTKDVLIGFHRPPFNSVNHLHLHVISPASRMSLWSRQVYKYNSSWFVTVSTEEHYDFWWVKIKCPISA